MRLPITVQTFAKNVNTTLYPLHPQTLEPNCFVSNWRCIVSVRYYLPVRAKKLLHDRTFSHAFPDVPASSRRFTTVRGASVYKRRRIRKGRKIEEDRNGHGTNANRGNLATRLLLLTDTLMLAAVTRPCLHIKKENTLSVCAGLLKCVYVA